MTFELAFSEGQLLRGSKLFEVGIIGSTVTGRSGDFTSEFESEFEVGSLLSLLQS